MVTGKGRKGLTGGEDLVMIGVLELGHDGPPIHTHEYMSEGFETLSGTLDTSAEGLVQVGSG